MKILYLKWNASVAIPNKLHKTKIKWLASNDQRLGNRLQVSVFELINKYEMGEVWLPNCF